MLHSYWNQLAAANCSRVGVDRRKQQHWQPKHLLLVQIRSQDNAQLHACGRMAVFPAGPEVDREDLCHPRRHWRQQAAHAGEAEAHSTVQYTTAECSAATHFPLHTQASATDRQHRQHITDKRLSDPLHLHLACAFLLQGGSPLPALPKGTAITLSANVDMQQSNPMHYKSTDEIAKFEQVGNCSPGACTAAGACSDASNWCTAGHAGCAICLQVQVVTHVGLL